MAHRPYAVAMRALALLLAVLLAPFAAGAAESGAVESPRARVTLVAEVASVAPGQPFRLALRQVLAPGWHSYWTNPGDAGEPPALLDELLPPPADPLSILPRFERIWCFAAPFSAPSAGPPPWHLHRFRFHTVFGVATAEPYGATRWRFEP